MSDNAKLLERLKMGDEKAANELIETNMGLVYSVVSRFANKRYETEDLAQVGAIGLIKAVKKFNFSYNVQFSTYAVPMIIGEIKRFLRDDGVIKVSRTLKENSIKGRRTEELLKKRLGRNPTVKEISIESGLTEEQIIEAFAAPMDTESLQASIGGEENENSRRLQEIITDEDEEEKIINKVFIKEALAELNERETKIIMLRYFRGKTQSEIAKNIGVSQVQISRIEKKAIEKIREKLLK